MRQGLQVHRPAAPACLEPGPEAHEAAGNASELRSRCCSESASACPASPCGPRSSSAFPARRDQDVDELLRLRAATTRFDHLGVFTYSHEEGTSAFSLDDDVPARQKQARRTRVMNLQKRLVSARQRASIGGRVRILIDGPSGDHDLVLKGRLMTQAPDIDAVGVSHRVRSVGLSGRRFCRGRDRRSARLRPDCATCAQPSGRTRCAIILCSEPGCRTEVGVCPLFSFKGVDPA